MNDHGIVTEAGAVRFERLLPASVERVWDYLTDPALRARWFAGGEMELRPGGKLTLVFRNSELAPGGEEIPDKFKPYEGMETQGEVIRADPPRRLAFLWFEEDGTSTEVCWELEARGEQTLMILTHRRLPSRAMMVDVAGGWHLHLDVLETVLAGNARGPFWPRQAELQRDYEARIPEDPDR